MIMYVLLLASFVSDTYCLQKASSLARERVYLDRYSFTTNTLHVLAHALPHTHVKQKRPTEHQKRPTEHQKVLRILDTCSRASVY